MLICVLQLYNHFCKCSPCSSCHLRFDIAFVWTLQTELHIKYKNSLNKGIMHVSFPSVLGRYQWTTHHIYVRFYRLTQCWLLTKKQFYPRHHDSSQGFQLWIPWNANCSGEAKDKFLEIITTIYKSPSLEEAAWRTRPKLCEIHCKDCCAYSQNSRCSWRLFDGTGWTQTHLRNPPHCTENLRTWRVD